MPFWLHDHSLVYKARSNSKLQRIIISSVLLGMISIGWYGGLHYFQIQSHARETTKHNTLLSDIKTLQASLSDHKTKEHNRHNIEHNLKKIRSTSYQHHDVVAYLMTTMNNHRIICTSMVPTDFTPTDALFKQITLIISARGRFDTFISLFKDISNADYLIELHDVMITRNENNELDLKIEIRVCT